MPKDVSSIRITRLIRLIDIFNQNKSVTRAYLMETLDYKHLRTLERDFSYLRSEFLMEIVYDKKYKTYRLTESAQFLCNVNIGSK